ncbi:MAG: DUF2191 domain-containing protein [Verrucomicrobia bacterium]|nr:DUF2191 domain-containing protein [Verrucomicrobiota bacterium]
MIASVRTTLVIDDHVLLDVKRQAIEAGLTVSEFTTLALREALRKREPPAHRARFSVPTFGSGAKEDSSPEDIADLRDDGG